MGECARCKAKFTPNVPWQRFCSRKCNNAFQHWSTEQQREWISGNWQRYLNRLAAAGEKRRTLTTQMLLEVLEEQGGRCALTGVRMTNILVEGKKVWTNASVDRIVSGGPYIKSNIQLVCAAVNTFRSQMSIEEFKEWCRLVAKFKGLPHGTRSKLPARVPVVSRKARAEEKPRAAQRRTARAHSGRSSAQGRREGRGSQDAHKVRRQQRTVKPSRNFTK